MNYKKELVIILAIAALLRFAPIFLYEMPIGYDAPFHLNMTEHIIETQSIQLVGNNYPPLYHISAAALSLITAIKPLTIIMILLPFFSVITVLSIFVLIRKLKNEKNAIVAALLIAVSSPLVAAAYDSPENIAFFLLPLILILFYIGRNIFASLGYVSFLLWNYFVFLITVIPMLFGYARKIKNLKYILFGIVLFVLFNFATKGSSFLDFGNVTAGMFFVMHNLRNSILSIILIASFFVLPLLYFSFRYFKEKSSKNFLDCKIFFICWLCVSYLSLLSFFAIPIFRPWEQLKFLALASAILIGLMEIKNKVKIFVILFLAFLLFSSIVVSSHQLFPRIIGIEINAIEFLSQHVQTGEKILAEPAFSEYISHYKPELKQRLLTLLYYEKSASMPFFERSLSYLAGFEENDTNFMALTSYPWVVVNYEDSYFRGTEKMESSANLNKVYSLEYEIKCPFEAFYGISPACGNQKTQIFKAIPM